MNVRVGDKGEGVGEIARLVTYSCPRMATLRTKERSVHVTSPPPRPKRAEGEIQPGMTHTIMYL